MSGATILMLVVAAVAIAAAARRWNLPSPLVLVVAGLALSFVPWIPNIELDPDLVLFGVLPPLLFNASLDSSYLNLRANVRPVALLSVGLVLFTTVVVGAVAYLVAGDKLGWALALVLGAVVSPPDAVASTAVARTLKLPQTHPDHSERREPAQRRHCADRLPDRADRRAGRRGVDLARSRTVRPRRRRRGRGRDWPSA